MEIKIEIGDNLKSIMEQALSAGYSDNIEDIIKAFNLEGVAESFLKAVMLHDKNKE